MENQNGLRYFPCNNITQALKINDYESIATEFFIFLNIYLLLSHIIEKNFTNVLLNKFVLLFLNILLLDIILNNYGIFTNISEFFDHQIDY